MSQRKKPLHYRYTNDDPGLIEAFEKIGIADSPEDAIAGVRHWIDGVADTPSMWVEETDFAYYVTVEEAP